MRMAVGRIVDLSHPIGPQTQVYPGDEPPEISPACGLAADGYNSVRVRMGSHTGTHADAPYHFLADGPRLDELPLELFTGPAVVVDATGLGPRTAIGPEALEPWADLLVPGAAVLVRTGWDRYYGTERYHDHPYLAAETARALVERGVRTLGVDTLSPDQTPYGGVEADDWSAHHAVLGAGGTIIENLCRLDRIDFADPWFCAFPIRLASGDGAPVRAVALDRRD
ncbi:cyclase family protein [Nocardiopsis potens]|uniref:cyclase family protein n=1 Tax=Nocardiopsis potens TaxID=1246458 RepID=UPI00034D2079